MSSYPIDIPQKRMSPSGGDKTSATILRHIDHAIWVQFLQPIGAQQRHDGLQIHTDVGPLGPTQVAVDVAEQGGGRGGALAVRGSVPLPRFSVVARGGACAAALSAGPGLALGGGRRAFGAGHLVLRSVAGVGCSRAFAGTFLGLV